MAHPAQADVPNEADGVAGTDTPGIGPTAPLPPRTSNEEAILAIWHEVLGRSDIGVLDDFFDLDGTSLSAIQVIARIRETYGVSIRAMDFFESPTVETLASAVSGAAPSDRPVVGSRPADADPVLSYDQQRLWLEDQLLPGAAYHVHGRQRLVGPLDVAALDASMRAILHRHEVLRSRFPRVDGRPVQLVDDLDENWHVQIEDLSLAGDDVVSAASRLADEDAVAPFDLERGPLFRCLLIRLSEAEHILSVTAHHIVCDDWSVGLFGRELSALYAAGGDARRAALPDIEIQYRDFAVWQRRWLTGEALERQVTYWRQHLAGAPPALALPTRRRRSSSGTPVGGRVRAELPEEDTVALHGLCRQYGVTPFMVLLAALGTVLGRWSGQRDVVIGTPITGRTDARTQVLIGFFVNTLPLRVQLTGDPTFAELLERARESAVGGFAHADAPLDLLVGELPAVRVPGRTPLFQVILNVVGSPEAHVLGAVSSEVLDAPVRPSKFDLTLTAREWDGVLRLDLEFDADQYDRAMMLLLLEHVTALLRATPRDPTRSILDYPLQGTADREPISGTPAEDPPALPHLAIERFAHIPDRVAVLGSDGEWSYRRLAAAADAVARALAQRFPADTEHHLGVVWRPAAACLAAIVGCVRAGAAFSLIDPPVGPMPPPGFSAVLDVSPAANSYDTVIDLRSVVRDATAPRALDRTVSEAPAATADWAVERYGFGSDDRFAVVPALPGYLVSALSSAFAVGANLALPEQSFADDPTALLAWMKAASVTVAYVTPPILRAMAARPEALPSLRHVFVDNAGDFLSHDVAALRRLSATCRCVGLYHVARDGRPAAAYQVPDDWALVSAPLRVPLGTGVGGVAVRLVHRSGRVAAIGEAAEIRLGTHRTGDLGRRWSDGSIEYVRPLGADPTADSVETMDVLRNLPDVYDALVTEFQEADASPVLVGYVAVRDRTLDVAAALSQLGIRLPDHMVPRHLVALDRLPLAPTGGYDLGALPHPDVNGAARENYVAPRTPLEQRLAGILRDLLVVDRIGVHDSFFELGGFSLLATQLSSRIRESVGIELTLRDIFESATVDALAQRIVRAQAEQARAEDVEALLDELEPSEAKAR